MAKKKSKKAVQQEIITVVYCLITMMLVIIGAFKLGILGVFIHRVFLVVFGEYPIFAYVLIFLGALYVLFTRKLPVVRTKIKAGLALGLLSLYLYLALASTSTEVGFSYLVDYLQNVMNVFGETASAHGGVFGALLYGVVSSLVAREGTWVVLVTTTSISLYLLVGHLVAPSINLKRPSFLSKTKKKKTIPVQTEMEMPVAKTMDEAIAKSEAKKSVFIDSETVTSTKAIAPAQIQEKPKTTSAATVSDMTSYRLPPLSLLDAFKVKKGSNVNKVVAERKGKVLIELLEEFQIKAELITYHIGPSVTKFEIRPEANVKVSKIASLSDNIKMSLQAKDIRIEAPIPGRNAVGVEIPNVEMTPVRLFELLSHVPAEYESKKLTFALGKNLMGKTIFAQLDKMPHLLIAGATGSGKSVAVNSIITTLLLRTTPSEVKLLLIDPKKVEFSAYHDLPHLIGPVISDANLASKALKTIVGMMENRYDVFAKVGARNIVAYNEKIVSHPEQHLAIMPRIVVIIDELADLMIVAGKEVEGSIQRITQLARAAGIHLIVATQRPSVDVITGVIKSNIPSRIAFAVSSGTDSRTILDSSGAERLLGYGDMLYQPIDEPNPIRIQGVFVSDDEVNKVTQAAKAQGKPTYDDAFIDLEGVDSNNGIVLANDDPLFEEVKSFIVASQKASTSMIQRRFSLGYNRAARMMDTLEAQGIIGPSQGSKPREVLVNNENE